MAAAQDPSPSVIATLGAAVLDSVRFVGGLPADPLESRIEFPIGMGSQDIWFGRPLLPETLGAVPYGERKKMVIDAINRLGPDNAVEVPNPPDSAFEGRVQAWLSKSGGSAEHATLLEVLRDVESPCDDTRRLLAAIDEGAELRDEPAGRWLAELADRLRATP